MKEISSSEIVSELSDDENPIDTNLLKYLLDNTSDNDLPSIIKEINSSFNSRLSSIKISEERDRLDKENEDPLELVEAYENASLKNAASKDKIKYLAESNLYNPIEVRRMKYRNYRKIGDKFKIEYPTSIQVLFTYNIVFRQLHLHREFYRHYTHL